MRIPAVYRCRKLMTAPFGVVVQRLVRHAVVVDSQPPFPDSGRALGDHAQPRRRRVLEQQLIGDVRWPASARAGSRSGVARKPVPRCVPATRISRTSCAAARSRRCSAVARTECPHDSGLGGRTDVAAGCDELGLPCGPGACREVGVAGGVRPAAQDGGDAAHEFRRAGIIGRRDVGLVTAPRTLRTSRTCHRWLQPLSPVEAGVPQVPLVRQHQAGPRRMPAAAAVR